MNEYKMVTAYTGRSLESEVNQSLRDGWFLHYGPVMSGDGPSVYYAQALVRRVDQTDERRVTARIGASEVDIAAMGWG